MSLSDNVNEYEAADNSPRLGPVAGSRAGDAYLVQPDSGPSHGVLLLHSWWGLTRSVKDVVESLADNGHTVLAPDLLGGVVPDDAEEAQQLLAESDPNATAALIMSSLVALRANTADPQRPVSVVGFSMGASWALWLATRLPLDVDAVVAYYGCQNIEFDDLAAPVLGHFAQSDPLVTEDDLVEMHSRLLLSEKSFELHRYEGTSHWFAESGVEGHFNASAAELAWQRTMEFLAKRGNN
ncbi:MAG: dienelactone hydrolase family protein [Microthrixaceae bacterium]